jgi:antitoxin CcdA
MKIPPPKEIPMRPTAATARNLTLNESYTVEQQSREGRRQLADACAADWNTVHEEVGSFADEHSTV